LIKWAYPTYLWFLLAVPLLVALVIFMAMLKRRKLRSFIDDRLLSGLLPEYSTGLGILRSLLLVGSLAFLLIAAARPKWGEKLQLYKGKGIDVVIALDASKSMLAEDVKPNRLSRARTELSALIDGLTGNEVGITAFAGDCYVMCPLTTDLDAAKLFLSIISPSLMPVPGTDFGRAIDVSMSLFNPEEKNYKALILVTDGDDLGKNTTQAVQRAVDAGVRIFPVAISTPEGGPIPEYDDQGTLKSYKKDKKGNLVMSRMNERELIIIARSTSGRFLRVEGFSAERLISELDKMRKKEIGGGSFTEYVERFQMFLIIAVVLFVGGMFLSDRKRKWWPKGLFGFVIFFVFSGIAQADVGNLMRHGNGLYARGKYDEALKSYQQAEVLEPDATSIHFNLGNTMFRLGKYQDAVNELELVLTDRNPMRRADGFYNIGNSIFKAGQLDGAIEAYKNALVLNPKDRQAKENLEYCLKKKQELKQRPDSTKQKQQNRPQPKQQPRMQPGPQKSKMSRDQARRVIQALKGKEKEEQKRAHQARRKRNVEKDW